MLLLKGILDISLGASLSRAAEAGGRRKVAGHLPRLVEAGRFDSGQGQLLQVSERRLEVHPPLILERSTAVAAGGRRQRLRAPRHLAGEEAVALHDPLHVVARDVEVRHGVHASELDRCDVVRLRSFFLST